MNTRNPYIGAPMVPEPFEAQLPPPDPRARIAPIPVKHEVPPGWKARRNGFEKGKRPKEPKP